MVSKLLGYYSIILSISFLVHSWTHQLFLDTSVCHSWIFQYIMFGYFCILQENESHGTRRSWEDDYVLKQAFSALVPTFDPRPGRTNIPQIQDFDIPAPGKTLLIHATGPLAYHLLPSPRIRR